MVRANSQGCLNVVPLSPRSGPSHLRRLHRPSPLHFRWHSSNVPGLGRQPQAPSSAVPAGLAAVVPGVRSEPRPAPAPAPRPPPSGGSVKPGGDGGGGGSPTRAGAGGGPAGGELAANTFPMVACRGKFKGRGSGTVRSRPSPTQPPPYSGLQFSLAAAPAPGLGSAPTPCATRNRTHCCRRGRRHHHRPAPRS